MIDDNEFPLAILKELMLWQNPDFHNFNILHAIAEFGYGIQLIDIFVKCQDFEKKKDFITFFMEALDKRGNSYLHLAASQNNSELLSKILSYEVSKILTFSTTFLL